GRGLGLTTSRHTWQRRSRSPQGSPVGSRAQRWRTAPLAPGTANVGGQLSIRKPWNSPPLDVRDSTAVLAGGFRSASGTRVSSWLPPFHREQTGPENCFRSAQAPDGDAWTSLANSAIVVGTPPITTSATPRLISGSFFLG